MPPAASPLLISQAAPGDAGEALSALPPSSGGGTAPNGKPIYSLSQVIDNFERWHEAWPTGATITYSFLSAIPPGSEPGIGFAPLTAVERQFVRAAFDLIADVANLRFVEAPPDGKSFDDSARIVFGLDSNAGDFEWGHTVTGSFNGFPNDRIANAEIWLSPEAVGERQWIYGGYNFMATIHEILHALGLPHPGDYNASADTDPTYAADATYYQDSNQYTVMSYFDGMTTDAEFRFPDASSPTGRGPAYSPSTPMLHDVAALQAIYGANTATRAGDTVYGYNSTAGRPSYDVTLADAPIFCIWDGGGIDTLDMSGSALTCRLDLNEGAFSDAFSMTGNISIAYGAKIENAKGGSADDILIGNALANHLDGGGGADQMVGGGGDDVLSGGAGVDVAAYAFASDNYAWWSNADGGWVVQDQRDGRPDGQDRLTDVETLAFTDRAVKLMGLTAAESLTQAFENVLRFTPATAADIAYVNGLAGQVGGGQLSLAQAFGEIVERADATTSVASLIYQFFTGEAPGKAGFDYLVAPDGPNPNNINSAYYQSFAIDNRYINFAVNVGAAGDGRAAFQAEYGGLSLFDATKAAYGEIFGLTPTDAKVHLLLDSLVEVGGQTITRADYLAIYGGDGLAGLGAKAAMVGWLLAVAEIEDVGSYALANSAYLTDLADGAPFHVDVVGDYGRPEFALAG